MPSKALHCYSPHLQHTRFCVFDATVCIFLFCVSLNKGFPGGSEGKEFACNAGDLGLKFLGWEDPREKGMAIHSSLLAQRIPWTEEPGRLPQRVGQDLVTNHTRKASVVVLNSFRFCLSGKSFISSSFMKGSFTGYSILS